MAICEQCNKQRAHPRCNPGTMKIARTDCTIKCYYCATCLYLLFFSYCKECNCWIDMDQDDTHKHA